MGGLVGEDDPAAEVAEGRYASGLTITRSAGAAVEPPASPVVTAAIPR